MILRSTWLPDFRSSERRPMRIVPKAINISPRRGETRRNFSRIFDLQPIIFTSSDKYTFSAVGLSEFSKSALTVEPLPILGCLLLPHRALRRRVRLQRVMRGGDAKLDVRCREHRQEWKTPGRG